MFGARFLSELNGSHVSNGVLAQHLHYSAMDVSVQTLSPFPQRRVSHECAPSVPLVSPVALLLREDLSLPRCVGVGVWVWVEVDAQRTVFALSA
jgi:hypothetical protein